MSTRLNTSLQENLLSLMAHDDKHGKIVVNMLDSTLFEGNYRIVAERAIDYWKRYGQAPKEHMADLLSEILTDKTNRNAPVFKRILSAMYDLAPNINTEYVIDSCRSFIWLQRARATILEAAELLHSQEELAREEVEVVLGKIMRAREIEFENGLRLSDYERVLTYNEETQAEFKLGIKPLDDHRIVPMRKTLFALLAPSSRGKTWGAVHIGKAAVLQRKKVLHISLEMVQEQVMQRYYQSLFAAPKHETPTVEITRFSIDNLGKLKEFEREAIKPEFCLDDPDIRVELQAHLEWLGVKLDNLIIKSFPMRSLTMDTLTAYLDNLELVEGFVPDLLIVDSPYLMKLNMKDYRISIGRCVEELRGLCTKRNMAGVMTHQVSREGAKMAQPGITQIGEDWSVIQTCDVVTILAATEFEFQRGLGRLFVGKSRDERDKFGVLLSQQYATGQFALQSMYLSEGYWNRLDELKGNSTQYDEDEEDE